MEQVSYEHQGTNTLCDQCDWVVVPLRSNEDKIICPRCGNLLVDHRLVNNQSTLIYTICALVMLCAACAFHFVDIRIFSNINNITIITIPRFLFSSNYIFLSLLFVAFVLLFPLLCLLSLIVVCSEITMPKRLKIILLVIINKLKSWCMADIFLAGVLVSFVKLNTYGEIGINASFIPYCFFILLQMKAFLSFNSAIIWSQIAPTIQTTRSPQAGKTGIEQGIRLCPCCASILYISTVICPRCYVRGHARIKQGLQWTMALLLTAIMLYVPANIFAVMTTFFLGDVTYSTIYDGISYMWQQRDYPIAIIIFTASVIIPVLKIVALFWLCYFSVYSRCENPKQCLKMNKIYNVIEFIGRWSMIDIFVVTVTSTLIRNGEIISVYPNTGAVFFALVVIITMIASKKYDPRLIWDRIR